MKRFTTLVVIVTLAVIGSGFLIPWNESISEVNVMTGAIRFKNKYLSVIESDWSVGDTWISQSASRQNIPTDSGWQFLSSSSKRLFTISRGSGRSPVSYQINAINPEHLELHSKESIDQFVREFVAADEATRRQMLMIQ